MQPYVVLTHEGAHVASWELEHPPLDLAAVDQLARLALHARRLGCVLRITGAGPDLEAFLEFVGLGELVASVEVRGEAERREEGGVDEVVVPDDPVA